MTSNIPERLQTKIKQMDLPEKEEIALRSTLEEIFTRIRKEEGGTCQESNGKPVNA